MADVYIASPSPGSVRTKFMSSCMNLVDYDRQNDRRIFTFVNYVCGPALGIERNRIVAKFLDQPCEWLLQIDSDMAFPPDILDRLLEVADEEKAPIVGAACALSDGRPNTLYWNAAKTKLKPRKPGKGSGPCVDVDATGGAFLLVHRKVFLSLLKSGQARRDPLLWFGDVLRPVQTGTGKAGLMRGVVQGEDTGFCQRAKEAGFGVKVLRGLGLEHEKTVFLQEPKW